MIAQIEFSFKKLAIFSLVVVAFTFWAGDSMAQSEQENSEMEIPKPIDKPILDNHSDMANSDGQVQNSIVPAAATVTPAKAFTPPKKNAHVSGEGKKPEHAPSTLSFNIFLYIVDKFKAD